MYAVLSLPLHMISQQSNEVSTHGNSDEMRSPSIYLVCLTNANFGCDKSICNGIIVVIAVFDFNRATKITENLKFFLLDVSQWHYLLIQPLEIISVSLLLCF